MRLENVEDIYPLTPLQQGLLFHSISGDDPSAYVSQVVFDIDDDALNHSRLRDACQSLIDVHTSLRTSIVWNEMDEPLQVVRRQATVELRSLDWSDVRTVDLKSRLDELLAQDRARGFDLNTAPLFRVLVIRKPERGWTVVWSFHHIVCDGWSTALMLREAMGAYRGENRSGGGSRFRDYVAWLADRDASADEALARMAVTMRC